MPKIHPTAEVDKTAIVRKNTIIWHYVQIRKNVVIGDNCIIGKNVYIDFGVHIGNNCKIQNNACIYHGATIGNGVFIGPACIITNDKNPRAVNEDYSLKKRHDWKNGKVSIENGASLGAGSIILPNITIGQFAMIGIGSVVTKNVLNNSLVYGNPAKVCGVVDNKGNKVSSQ